MDLAVDLAVSLVVVVVVQWAVAVGAVAVDAVAVGRGLKLGTGWGGAPRPAVCLAQPPQPAKKGALGLACRASFTPCAHVGS